MADISTPAARRAAVQGVADFLRAGGDLTDLERQALAALDRDEEAAIERGVAALEQPAAEVTVDGGTVESFVLFPNVQRRAAPAPIGDSHVYCEAHPGEHVETPACAWPHYVAPAGREPRVGHPYRSND